MRCYCCSGKSFQQCCSPFIERNSQPSTPEQLMRSRFSAYCIGNYKYILDTYTEDKASSLSMAELEESAQGCKWFALEVTTSIAASDSVSFKAFYFLNRKPHMLHETSRFIQEQGKWRYSDGDIHQDSGQIKLGRNDLCPCNSKKKFKQCCLKRM